MPSDGEGDEGEPGTRHGVGCVTGWAVILVVVVAVTGLALFFGATDPLYLTRAHHGATPVFRKETGGGPRHLEHHYLTWDVRKRVESGFRPEDPHGFRFEGRALGGELTFSVPRNCIDRRIRWQIRVDGDPVGSGSLRWLRTYTVKTDFAIDRTPDSVEITMAWDGGDADCPSFSAEWKDAQVVRDHGDPGPRPDGGGI
ncbi:hypothetical protein ACTWQF_20230 [Streptomyces sp. 8N114]|uniref:hypothetical protein n=1 Tax=Streptomyces sp. 8N114 TaxID=3457419 RepID=UPI003FD0F4A7